jgi:hypothetical protein
MALTISIPNTLRKQVEAASQGKNTVHYTAKGQPSYFYVLEAFNDAVLGALHPAFSVAKLDGSGNTAKTEIFVGMYLGHLRNGELLSLPGVAPTASLTHDQVMTYALACGTGYHAANNAEWAALQQACYAAGFQPNGNTNYGRSSDNTAERGVNSTTGRLAATTGTATTTTLTGSGPSSWRHTNNAFGISDLCGCLWEWSPGVRINSGEINVISYDGTTIANPALASVVDLAAASAKWYAIDGATGALVAATLGSPVTGTVRYVNSNSLPVQAYSLYRATGGTFEGMLATADLTGTLALNLCRMHGFFPVAGATGSDDGFYLNTAGEMCPLRGGSFYNSGLSGLSALNCDYARSTVSTVFGGRLALSL